MYFAMNESDDIQPLNDAGEPGYDEALPRRLAARHRKLRNLAQEMWVHAERSELDGIAPLLQAFYEVREAQVEDREVHMFAYAGQLLRDDTERRAQMQGMLEALSHHTRTTGAFMDRYLMQGVGPLNLHDFRRDLQDLQVAIFHHAAYAECYFLPLYDELGWKSGTLTLPPRNPAEDSAFDRHTGTPGMNGVHSGYWMSALTPHADRMTADGRSLARLVAYHGQLQRLVTEMGDAVSQNRFNRVRSLLAGFRNVWLEKAFERDTVLGALRPLFQQRGVAEADGPRPLQGLFGSVCRLIDRFLDEHLYRGAGRNDPGVIEGARREVEAALSDYFARAQDIYRHVT